MDFVREDDSSSKGDMGSWHRCSLSHDRQIQELQAVSARQTSCILQLQMCVRSILSVLPSHNPCQALAT